MRVFCEERGWQENAIDPVIEMAGGARQDQDVSMAQDNTPGRSLSCRAAQPEPARCTEGDGKNGDVFGGFVRIAVEAHFRGRTVKLDEPGLRRRRLRQKIIPDRDKGGRHFRPGRAVHGMARLIAIAAPIGDPPQGAKVHLSGRHGLPSRGHRYNPTILTQMDKVLLKIRGCFCGQIAGQMTRALAKVDDLPHRLGGTGHDLELDFDFAEALGQFSILPIVDRKRHKGRPLMIESGH